MCCAISLENPVQPRFEDFCLILLYFVLSCLGIVLEKDIIFRYYSSPFPLWISHLFLWAMKTIVALGVGGHQFLGALELSIFLFREWPPQWHHRLQWGIPKRPGTEGRSWGEQTAPSCHKAAKQVSVCVFWGGGWICAYAHVCQCVDVTLYTESWGQSECW